MKTKMILTALCALSVWQAVAQTYDTNNVVVQTFAGSGFSGHVDGVGQLTMFKNPSQLVSDSSSNLFVWDSGNSCLRKITPDGTVSTFAGGGSQSTGTGTNVSFLTFNNCMTIDRSDNIWAIFNPNGNPNYLYKITSNATVTRTSLPASLSYPSGMCIDSAGTIYISDTSGSKIYQYHTNGVLSVFAGSGNYGYADGNGIFTSFSLPRCLAADGADNIYVWDSGNYLIRRIDQSQNVTTIAGSFGNGGYSFQAADGVGTNAGFFGVNQMCFDGSGNLILACAPSVRQISPATNVTTIAGSFNQYGYTNGAGNQARFNQANGVCVSQGAIFIADAGNQRIRQISFNPSPQVVTGANLGIATFAGVTITGTVGRTYQVQSSADMTNWTARVTLLLTSSPYLWIDQNPVSGNKFYRALMLP